MLHIITPIPIVCFNELSEITQPRTISILTRQGQLLSSQIGDGNLISQATNINRDNTVMRFEERISNLERNMCFCKKYETVNIGVLETPQISKKYNESFTTESGETLQFSYMENVSVQVEEKVNALKTNLSTLQKDLRVSQESFNELQEVVKISNSYVKKMGQTLKASQKRNTELEEKLQIANTSISHLKTDLQNSQSDLNSLTDKFNASQIRMAELERLLQAANLTMNSFQGNCATVQTNLHRSLEVIGTIQNMGNGRRY